MSEVGGITELQMLESQQAVLTSELNGVKKAEKTSVACKRLEAAIQADKDKDDFLVKEAGAVEQNQYHTSAASSGEAGCCVIL
jgi:hypothetical protein